MKKLAKSIMLIISFDLKINFWPWININNIFLSNNVFVL